MITDKDIEKLKAVFVTKDDLGYAVGRLERKLDRVSKDIKAIHQDLTHHDQRFEKIEAQLGDSYHLRDKRRKIE